MSEAFVHGDFGTITSHRELLNFGQSFTVSLALQFLLVFQTKSVSKSSGNLFNRTDGRSLMAGASIVQTVMSRQQELGADILKAWSIRSNSSKLFCINSCSTLVRPFSSHSPFAAAAFR